MLCQTAYPPIDQQPSVDDDDLQSLEWLQNFDISRITRLLHTEPEITQKTSSLISDASDSPGQKRKLSQCTFSCMIFRAIEESPHRALPLQSIYRWIEDRYPHFGEVGSQWKNSVRHNLSFNQCFIRLKVDQEDCSDRSPSNTGSTAWWTVHPDFRNAYSTSVLAQGSAHVCLPRGICGGGLKSTSVTRLSTSEHELTVLANDISAAATILALKEPLGSSNRNRSMEGANKASKGLQCRKRKIDREFVVSRDIAEDHRYISENNSKRAFTISSLIGGQPSSTPQPSKSSDKTKPTADASVQVCASDFDNNKPFVVSVRPRIEPVPKRKRTRRCRK